MYVFVRRCDMSNLGRNLLTSDSVAALITESAGDGLGSRIDVELNVSACRLEHGICGEAMRFDEASTNRENIPL